MTRAAKRKNSSRADRLSYGVSEAAELVGVSVHTLRRDLRAGRIRATKYGKKWLISAAALERVSQHGLKIAS